MNYISTRGGVAPQQFSDILLGGLMADGGLSIPQHYPQFTQADLESMASLNYRDLAFAVISRFVDDIPADDLKALIDKTYTAEVYCNGRSKNQASHITPLIKLDNNLYIQELSNGPTLAFKDMAMQLLGNLFEYVLDKKGEQINILGATSGDTGSAAEYAMRGKRGVNVFMLSPFGKMSPFQRAQMFSLQDENIFNLSVHGFFDACQDIVKDVNKDADFKAKHKIGAVNSINWGRIVAQVVYYFKGYFAMVLASGKKVGDKVDFCVPSGNFGNICAGHIARQMGLPIGQLIVATNENDVLDEFFKTGGYHPRGLDRTYETTSPSMDITKASNLERFVFDLIGRDAERLAAMWKSVESGSGFELSTEEFATMRDTYGFKSEASNHADRITHIREVFEKYGVQIDPHTADGFKAAKAHRNPAVPMVIMETALPAKFEDTMQEALKQAPYRPKGLAGLEALPQRFDAIDADAELIKKYLVERIK